MLLVSQCLQIDRRTEILEDDVFDMNPTLSNGFDVVRAANILNQAYFHDADLESALVNLRGRVRPAGLLVVCRLWPDDSNHGTVFRLKRDGRLSHRLASGNGSDVESHVIGLPKSS